MSTENIISISLEEEDITGIQDALDGIDIVLDPLLIALTPQQRRTLPKMSDGTLPFVSKVMDYAESDPQFVPPFLDVPELKKDFDAVDLLMPLQRRIEQLNSKLADTLMLAGSEAYVASLSYYHSVKMGVKMNVPGAKPIFDDLSKRFEKRGAPTGPTEE